MRFEFILTNFNTIKGRKTNMAIFILLVSFLSFNILFTTPVSATYPTPDIAHWDLSVSDERNDADYKEVQRLVEQKYLDAALALLNKKIEE